VALTSAGTGHATVKEVLGDAVSETVRDGGSILVVSLNGWKFVAVVAAVVVVPVVVEAVVVTVVAVVVAMSVVVGSEKVLEDGADVVSCYCIGGWCWWCLRDVGIGCGCDFDGGCGVDGGGLFCFVYLR